MIQNPEKTLSDHSIKSTSILASETLHTSVIAFVTPRHHGLFVSVLYTDISSFTLEFNEKFVCKDKHYNKQLAIKDQ